MKKLPFLRSLSFAACALLLSGCGGTVEKENSGSKGVIAYSMLTSQNPFFNVIADNMKEAAEAEGYELLVVDGGGKMDTQYGQVRDFIARKVSAIVLNPCNAKGVGSAIAEANKAGIPVFTCDLKSLADQGDVVAHIATDNRQGGVLAGEAMAEALGDAGGKVVILDYKAAESCILRVDGFKEAISKHNASATGKIEIVAELPGEGRKEDGHKVASDAIQAHPDLAGIFAINDPSGLGAWGALEEASKADQVTIIAFDGQPEGKIAVKDGKIYASPVQFPSRMGKKTIEAILKYFNGEKVEKEELIPVEIYKKEQADKDPNIEEWG